MPPKRLPLTSQLCPFDVSFYVCPGNLEIRLTFAFCTKMCEEKINLFFYEHLSYRTRVNSKTTPVTTRRKRAVGRRPAPHSPSCPKSLRRRRTKCLWRPCTIPKPTRPAKSRRASRVQAKRLSSNRRKLPNRKGWDITTRKKLSKAPEENENIWTLIIPATEVEVTSSFSTASTVH